VKISAKLITIITVTKTPKASGVKMRAKSIVVTGATNLAAISVTEDHLVAVTIFLFKLPSATS
jgi:hypothetical protein